MKKLLLALTLVTTQVFAQPAYVGFVPGIVVRLILDSSDDVSVEGEPITVLAGGSGDTCNEALTNAKKAALERVNGSWVHSIARSKNGSYDEEIVQYSGGVVKSYKIVKDECTNVIIEAQVLKRSNRVQLEAADIKKQQIIHIRGIKESIDRKAQAVSTLDNRGNAVYFSPSTTEMSVIDNGNVKVVIEGTFAYRDKWKADYLYLREQVGYFNLPNFAYDAKVIITGYDELKEQVYQTSFYHDDWDLWTVRTWGATRTMDIHPSKTQEAKINFQIPMDKLERVKSFKVEIQ